MNDVEEVALTCPACNAPISVLIDSSAGDQSYIEDCEVCCRPLTISFIVTPDGIDALQVEHAD
jgi:hypothetical protein